MLRSVLFAFSIAYASSAVHAASWQAESTHYVVYSSKSADDARKLAIKLEKYETIMRFLNGVKVDVAAPKVRLLMAKDSDDVEKLLPFGGGGVLGFYSSDVRGPYAVMDSLDDGIEPQTVLFHELAHHFMFAHFPATYPTWYSEGFADYHGTMRIGDKDQVTVGDIVANRYRTLAIMGWVPVGKILGAHGYGDAPTLNIYAEGWLLVHMLSTDASRKGQLAAYLKAINSGQSYDDAAKVFGDLGKLDSDLQRYAKLKTIPTITYPFKPINPGSIEVRQLSGAEDALLKSDFSLMIGVAKNKIDAFADNVETIAGRFPTDPTALRVSTDSLLTAGRNQEAAASASRWLSITPRDPKAIAMKALANTRMLVAAKSTDVAAYDAARAPLRDIVKTTQDPYALMAFYETFAIQSDTPPPPIAWKALTDAYAMLPGDDDVAYVVARDYEKRGMIDDAIAEITPFALFQKDDKEDSPKQKAKRAKQREKFALAGEEVHESAREMLTRLQKMKGQTAAAVSQN